MRVLAATGVGLMADLPVPEAAEPTAEIVEKYDGFDQTVFAGDIDSLLRVRRRWPRARIALSWNSPEPPTPAPGRRASERGEDVEDFFGLVDFVGERMVFEDVGKVVGGVLVGVP